MKFLKNLFKKDAFKNGQILNISENTSVIDRTNTLVDYALKNDLTILAGNQGKIDILKSKSPEVKVVGFAPNFTKHLSSLDLSNGVLVDETVALEMIDYLTKELSEIKIRGGYYRYATEGSTNTIS